MRVLLLSRHSSRGASSRLRHLQYLDDFRANGWTVEVSPLFPALYLDALYSGRGWKRHLVRGYLRRFLTLLRIRQFDLLIIEKELFPFLPAWAERAIRGLGIPCMVDYDDAQFHRYELHRSGLIRRLLGRKIDAVMHNASLVTVGNQYLADRARQAGARRVEVIPTVVDAARYQPAMTRREGPPVVGWIGTPKTSHYLQPLLPAFAALQQEMSIRFMAIGAHPSDFADSVVEVRPWTEETEVRSLQQCDIGIMPLPDSPWERGKCGYKLIQYMACGLPVVASPVGINNEIVKDGLEGWLASTKDEWIAALRSLATNREQGRQMGLRGREKVESWYCRQVQAPRLLAAARQAVDGRDTG